MRKYGENKRLKLWWQLYVTWLPVRDLENFRLIDFCPTECTTSWNIQKLCVLHGSQNNSDYLYTTLTYRFWKWGRECLPCGTNWVFKSDRYSFVLKGLMLTLLIRGTEVKVEQHILVGYMTKFMWHILYSLQIFIEGIVSIYLYSDSVCPFVNMTGVNVAAAVAGCILPECSDRVVGSGGMQMASFRTWVVVRSGEQDG